jgi:hypothetical protein
MDHNVIYDDEKVITQILYNTLPPAYQTTVELTKRDRNRKVPVTLFQVQEDMRQIYGQLQQHQHLVVNIIQRPEHPFIRATPYLLHFPRKLNHYVAFVTKWNTKLLIFGTIPTTETNLAIPNFPNTLNQQDLHALAAAQTNLPTMQMLIRLLLLLSLHALIAIALIILKLNVSKDK